MTRGRRTRSQKTLDVPEESPQETRRRSLRRNRTSVKITEPDDSMEEEDQNNDEDEEEESPSKNGDVDDRRYRRLKKVKKNLNKSDTNSEVPDDN